MKHDKFFLSILFYLVLFACYRLVFLLLYAPAIDREALFAFVAGFRLDLAVCAYLQVLPFLVWMASFDKMQAVFSTVLKSYHAFVIAMLHLLGAGNLIVYKFWDSLMNWRALSYLDNPKEAMASVEFLPLTIWIGLLLLAIYFSMRVFMKRFYTAPALQRTWTQRLAVFILAPGLLLLAARGGFQLLPVNESVAYYSSTPQLNDAAVNSVWHLGHSASVAASSENPSRRQDAAVAKQITDSLLSSGNDTVVWITGSRPNIVSIILESFSSDLLGCQGGNPSAAPFLDSLASQGMLFTNLYASGFRTDQGLPSLLSGFPATPLFSVMRYPEKSAQLPSLFREVEKVGYSTSFYYGGAGNFRNMKSYGYNLGVDVFLEEADFDASLPRCKWGVHDEYVLKRQAAELRSAKTPFFSVVMTLSNHEPYDIPTEPHFPGHDDPSRFRSSAFYTDYSLQQYFREVSAQPWYSNTLFVLVADHGHTLPMKRPMPAPSSHKMPWILAGPALKPEYRGTRVSVIGNHHDVPATMLAILGLSDTTFPWSRNLLAHDAKSFAYYEQEDGFGWIEPGGWIYFSSLQNRTLLRSDTLGDEHAMIRRGGAYLQVLFDQFLAF